MKRPLAVLLAAALAAAGCRTARPAGNETPVAPLAAPNSAAAFSELQSRRASFAGERSLMRIRATAGERTQSFRALLQADRAGRMMLTAYTPVGTTAMTLFADGDRVVFLNAIERTAWQGSAAEFTRGFGFFGALTPYDAAMLIFGLPARSDSAAKLLSDTRFGSGRGVIYDVAPTGLTRATIEGDTDVVDVTYEPAAQPPQQVVVAHGSERLEIQHLESMMSDATLAAPPIPNDYRCCVAPRLP